MQQNAHNLEPKDGDFVRYLKELESGQISQLKGLHVNLQEAQDTGIVTVRTGADIAQEQTRQRKFQQSARQDAVMLTVRLISPLVAVLGFVLMALGMYYPYQFESLIPVGMFVTFAGFVLTGQTRKKK